jgi:hypothetical protein
MDTVQKPSDSENKFSSIQLSPENVIIIIIIIIIVWLLPLFLLRLKWIKYGQWQLFNYILSKHSEHSESTWQTNFIKDLGVRTDN